jgi:hypothetical protein
VTSEQRGQTAHSVLALRVALLFRLSDVARQSKIHKEYSLSSRLGEAKNLQQRGMPKFFNSLSRRSRCCVGRVFGSVLNFFAQTFELLLQRLEVFLRKILEIVGRDAGTACVKMSMFRNAHPRRD